MIVKKVKELSELSEMRETSELNELNEFTAPRSHGLFVSFANEGMK